MNRWQQRLLYYRLKILARGQGLVEYALILVFVAVVLIAILVILGPGISNIYQNIVDVLKKR